MKRTVVVLLLSLLAVAGVAAWRWWPRTTPPERVSDLYRRYEPNPHLSVAFIEGFKVNDTLAVDVTTVTALDDEGWDTLQHDFDFAELPPVMLTNLKPNSVFTKYVPKKDYSQPMDRSLINNDIIMYSMHKRELSLFHIENEEQITAIFEYIVKQVRIKKEKKVKDNNNP